MKSASQPVPIPTNKTHLDDWLVVVFLSKVIPKVAPYFRICSGVGETSQKGKGSERNKPWLDPSIL